MPFYAVRRGRQTGIFATWKECEEQVKGFPGPSFRKFHTEAEAVDFVKGGGVASRKEAAGVKRRAADGVWYAVHKGRQTGLFSTWEECQAQVAGFHGAVFNKFSSHADASAFVVGGQGGTSAHAASGPPPVAVYTDGGCFSNGRKGARAGFGVWWGAGHPWNACGRLKGRQTNNRAEIEAAVAAVRRAQQQQMARLEIRTDSSFLIKCMTSWVHRWRHNGWLLSDGGQVKVKAQVQRLHRLLQESGVQVTWTHVKGHAGERGNEEADRLAREGAMMAYPCNPLDSTDDEEEM